MTQTSNSDENMDINQMDSAQKQDYLKALTTGRDPKNGKFIKGRTGNPKGRPRARTNLDDCLNMVFAQKTNITIEGKRISTTMLQALCYKLMSRAVSSDDDKFLFQVMKIFGPRINLYEELPKPKAESYANDPTVEKIKKAIYNYLDNERDQYKPTSKDFI